LFDGMRYLMRQPVLRALALFQTGVALMGSIGIGAAVIDLLVYRMKVDLSESSNVVGACLAVASLGAVLGALLAGRLRNAVSLATLPVAGPAAQALGLVTAGLGSGIVSIMIGGAFWAGGLTCRAVGATSLRQTLTPDALIGRVVAAGWTLIF